MLGRVVEGSRGAGALRALILGAVLAAAAAAALAQPPQAGAHAVLEQSTPHQGAVLQRAPDAVSFRFSEPVEASLGAVRAFDASGQRVDTGEVTQPGDATQVAVCLERDLPEGSYTATYRVVGPDGHTISGGLLFSIEGPSGAGAGGSGHADAGAGAGGSGEADGDASSGRAAGAASEARADGTAEAVSVGELLARTGAGTVTEGAFGVVRAVAYTAIALAIGGLAFLVLVWLPALGQVAGPQGAWREASERFAARLRWILAAAVVAGIATSGLGILLQGATAGGISLWSAIDPEVAGEVLASRFGAVWALRGLLWVTVGLALAVSLAPRRAPVLRPAVGADGNRGARPPSTDSLVSLALLLGLIALTPALAGHASTQGPAALLVPANLLHVLAMSIWIGGLAVALAGLPAATGRLDGTQRTRLLAAALARFSPLALAAVITLLASGLVQSSFHVGSPGNLLSTPYGTVVLVKLGLLACLIGLGAISRQRVIPRLQELAADGKAPGGAGRLLRRTLAGEVAVLAVVLGATAALVSYAPPAVAGQGPFSAIGELGPARMELVVEPAEVGPNDVHVYLLDPRDGSQYTGIDDVAVELSPPPQQGEPIRMDVRDASPGHYVAYASDLSTSGEWQLEVSATALSGDTYRTNVEVPIE